MQPSSTPQPGAPARQGRRRGRAGWGQRSVGAAEIVIVTPTLLLLILAVIQFALAEQAEHVAQAAASQALAAARVFRLLLHPRVVRGATTGDQSLASGPGWEVPEQEARDRSDQLQPEPCFVGVGLPWVRTVGMGQPPESAKEQSAVVLSKVAAGQHVGNRGATLVRLRTTVIARVIFGEAGHEVFQSCPQVVRAHAVAVGSADVARWVP